MPRILAMDLAVGMKGSVEMKTAGLPAFSTVMASCILHELQDPQSPVAVITRSHFASNSSMMCWGAGREASPLFRRTVPLKS